MHPEETMSESFRNGSSHVARGESEMPFPIESPYHPASRAERVPARASVSEELEWAAESPFARETGAIAAAATDNRLARQYSELLGELYDREFEDAVIDLAHETAAIAHQQFSWEGEDAAHDRAVAERALRQRLAPLQRDSEQIVDQLMAYAETADTGAMSEAELEAFLDRFQPGRSVLEPSMAQFASKWLKKVKRVARKTVKLAKKGIALAKKLSPLHIALAKLKKLVKPLLERVLKFALDRLPVALRPVASQLASKLFGISPPPSTDDAAAAPAPTESPTDAVEDAGAGAAASNPAEIQSELDAELAGHLVGGEAFEQQLAAETMAATDPLRAMALRRLVRARRHFGRRAIALREGESSEPALEQFVPAILGAAKIGISIMGRPNVVKQLSKMVAPLISPYVGKASAAPLSTALVDTGLRMMNLELSAEEHAGVAGDTIAAAVEGATRRVLREAPPEAWEDRTMLHGYLQEAIEQEAAASFPDADVRRELHETAQMSGQWMDMPLTSATKTYRKYSRVPEVTVTPQKAAELVSFGAAPLAAILRDQLGLPEGAVVRAKVHLYEAKPGTTLSLIALNERGVRGLGHARRDGWSLIHPLTRAAAGLLLGEPGLGVDVDARFLADGNLIEIGQRFYYLEIADAQPRIPWSGRGLANEATGATSDHRLAHTSQASFVVDTTRGEIRVALFYSEKDAQSLAARLRKRTASAVVLAAMRRLHRMQLHTALARPGRGARIVQDAIQNERSPAVGTWRAIRQLGDPLHRLLADWLLDATHKELEERYDQLAQRFAAAADATDDGVTLLVAFDASSSLEPIRKAFQSPGQATAASLQGRRPLGATIDVKPGFVDP
jgi:hypothetical protein